MITDPIHIKFNNQQNPTAGFDIVRLEHLLTRQDMDHSPFQLHVVEFYLILIIEKGKGKHTIDFKEYVCQPGTVLTIRKDQIQRFHPSKTLEGYMLLFTDAFMVSYLEHLEALKSLQLFNEYLGAPKIQLSTKQQAIIGDLIQRTKTEYFTVRDAYSLGIIRSELHILITKLYRIKSGNDQLIENRQYLTEFIEFQNLVEKEVANHKKVTQYARMIGVSTKTLNTVTKQIINKTAKEFIDDICIQQIKRLLINTDLSIKEIAYALGFEETTNFYKYFKRLTGIPPEQFRTSLR